MSDIKFAPCPVCGKQLIERDAQRISSGDEKCPTTVKGR